jgi:small subunit ribosomal protein S20
MNKSYLSSVKTAIKKFRTAAEGLKTGDVTEPEKVQTLFVGAQSFIMKAANKGILHKNNASRRVSRLTKVLADAVTNAGSNKKPAKVAGAAKGKKKVSKAKAKS